MDQEWIDILKLSRILQTELIHTAVEHNNKRIVEALLEDDPKLIHCLDDFGYYPMWFAISEENPQMVDLLLKHGATMQVHADGEYAIHRVLNDSSIEFFKFILNHPKTELVGVEPYDSWISKEHEVAWNNKVAN